MLESLINEQRQTSNCRLCTFRQIKDLTMITYIYKINWRYNIIFSLTQKYFLSSFQNSMSFYFAPVQSQNLNYCIFMPMLPYVFQIPANNVMGLNPQFPAFDLKQQEIDTLSPRNIENKAQSRKQRNVQQEQSPSKNQSSLCIYTKKQTAALSSQSIGVHEKNPNANGDVNSSQQNLQKPNKKIPIKMAKAIKIKKVKNLNEEQYKPFEKRRKLQTFSKENQNRNIIPNQVNQIFSYIQKGSKSQIVVSRIFKKFPPINENFNFKKFYLYQSLLKSKISNYITQGSLSLVSELYEPRCDVYSEQEQRYYNKVCRILIHHFLQEDSIFNILTSRRMHREKKRNHLQMRRTLKQKVINILKH